MPTRATFQSTCLRVPTKGISICLEHNLPQDGVVLELSEKVTFNHVIIAHRLGGAWH
jgi:hypothetical protein